MTLIPPDEILFLNRRAENLRGPADALSGPLAFGTSRPNVVRLVPGLRLRLTTLRLNPEAVGEVPTLGDVEWTIPRDGQSWSNRDVAMLGFLLGFCPLAYSDGGLPAPTPADYIKALYRDPDSEPDLAGRFDGALAKAAMGLVERIGLRFGFVQDPERPAPRAGFHAEEFARSYHALSQDDLGGEVGNPRDPGRDRVLAAFDWPSLDRETGRLVPRDDPDGAAMSWRQVGFVMPQDYRVSADRNPLVRSSDLTTTISVDLEAPVYRIVEPAADAEPVYLPVWYSIQDARDRLVNGDMLVRNIDGHQEIRYLQRTVTSGFVKAFRGFSAAADEAFQDQRLLSQRFSGDIHTVLCVVPGNPDRRPCLQLASSQAEAERARRSLLIHPHDVYIIL